MSRSAAQEAQTAELSERLRARTEARIEDLEFLLSAGVCVEEAVSRAGWPSLGAARRALDRRGRHDLARVVGPAIWAVREVAA